MPVCWACAKEYRGRFCSECGSPAVEAAGAQADPYVGRTLPGGYRLLELLAIGGMGRVYRGEQTSLGRSVAVKLVHEHFLTEPAAAVRFMTEARAASRLNHPNSLAIIDFGRAESGQSYLVMEYLRGRTLTQLLTAESPLEIPRVLEMMRQILGVLADAHDLGIVHRDLKPDNIVVERARDGGDFLKVVDFGIAKMIGASASLTQPGLVCGTPDYMAPEQVDGGAVDARTDIYSAGVLLFLMLTQRLPFLADDPNVAMNKRMIEVAPDPRVLAPPGRMSDAIANACFRALAKSPGDRFASAEEFARALGIDMSERMTSTASRAASCSACGYVDRAASRFCRECGMRVLLGAEATKSAYDDGASAAATAVARPKRASEPSPGEPAPPVRAGRDADLAWLLEQRRDVRASVVGARLVGEEGMGKSWLLRELAARARTAGDLVVEVGPDPWCAEVSSWTLRRMIEQLARLEGGATNGDAWVGASADARAGLRRLFAPDAEADPRGYRGQAAAALRWAITRATQLTGGTRRVLVAIDDLHRVDGATRVAVADALRDPPVALALVIVAHVPSFDPAWSVPSAVRSLEPLALPLLAELFGTQTVASLRRRDTLVGWTPMHVEQTRRLRAEGGGDTTGGLADVLAQRLVQLDVGARHVLQTLSVLGDEATDEELKSLVGRIDWEASALALVERGLVVRTPRGLRACHPMLRDVSYASIPVSARRQLHARAFELAQAAGLPYEVQALHAVASDNSEDALRLLAQVASRAGAAGDLAGQIGALRRGLDAARRELLRGELESPELAIATFSEKLAAALAETGAFQEAEGVLREAIEQVPPGRARASLLECAGRVARARAARNGPVGPFREAILAARETGATKLATELETLEHRVTLGG